MLRGLRVTGFYDDDNYVKDAERTRAIVGVTFEHTYVNAGFDYLDATRSARRCARPQRRRPAATRSG